MQDSDEESKKIFQDIEKQQAKLSQQNLKIRPIVIQDILEGQIDDVQEYNLQRNQEPRENLNGKTLKISEIQSHYVNWRLIGLVKTKGPIYINKQKEKTFFFELEDPDYENIEIKCCHKHFDLIMLGKSYIFSKIYVPQDKYSKFTNTRQILLKSWSDIREIQQDKSQILQNQLEKLCQILQSDKIEITKLGYDSQNNFQQVQLKPLFFPNPENEKTYQRYLKTTQKKLLVCMYSFTSNDILRNIQAMKNVRIKIIVDLEQIKQYPQQRDCLDKLSRMDNVKVKFSSCEIIRTIGRTFRSMHNKFVVIDDKTVMLGSLNWSYSAFKSNYENVLIVEDPKLSQDYTNYFYNIWKKSTSYKHYFEQLIQTNVDIHQQNLQINQENKDNSKKKIKNTQQVISQKDISEKINDLNSQPHEILQHQNIQNEIVKKNLQFIPKLQKPAQIIVIKNGNNYLENISSFDKKINKQQQKEQKNIENSLEIQQNFKESQNPSSQIQIPLEIQQNFKEFQNLPSQIKIPLKNSEQSDEIQTPQFFDSVNIQQDVEEEISAVIQVHENNMINFQEIIVID